MLREKISHGASAEEILALLRAIGAGRPAVAIELAQAIGRADDETVSWVNDLARQWTAREPTQAWQWILAQSGRLERLGDGSLMHVVLDEMARRAPELVVANVDAALRMGTPPGGISAQVIAHGGVEALLKHDNAHRARELVEKWAREASPAEIGIAAYAAVALDLAKASAGDAAAWLQSLPTSADRNAALGALAGEWVSREPAAALSWSETLSPADGREQVVQRAFGDWLERDAVQAAQWLGERLAKTSGGADMDPLIANLIHESSLTKGDPHAAMRWIDLMTDSAKRVELQDQVLVRWGSRDLVAASNYLASATTIPDERRVVLLQQMRTHHVAPESSTLWFASDAFPPKK